MKILFMEWDSFGNPYIKNAWKNAGYEVVIYDFPQKTEDTRANEALSCDIVKKMMESGAELVFSFNYFPVIAMAAKACRKKYFAWIYDNPAILLYSQTVFFDTNYIFHFDSSEVHKLQKAGVEHIYYLPLAAAVLEYDEMVPNQEQIRKYSAEVAMIGSMYCESRYQIFHKFESFDNYLKGYLDAIVNAQKEIYGVNIMEESLKPEIMQKLSKSIPIETHADGWERPEWVIANYYIAKNVTAMARKELLQTISEVANVTLYTMESTPQLPKVRNAGCVDYYHEAPYAIKCAKINLNCSLRSITSGIPLRAMDILGCGGFLLTNYQADFMEHFIPDEDFVFYESTRDAVQLVQYYLKNEDKRKRIALSGYQKAKSYHTFSERVHIMLSLVSS